MGLVLGLAAGVAAGLLAAPMRGSALRASLRSRAEGALDRGARLLEEGRHAFERSDLAAPGVLTATLGEMTQSRPGQLPTSEARS